MSKFCRFRLFPFRSPLLRECFPHHCGYFFLFLRLLRCFNSPGSPLTVLYIQTAGAPSSIGQVPPFGDPRVKGCLPPYRGLSQAATSFIVFLCQGIHHILLMRFSHIFDKNVEYIITLRFCLMLFHKLLWKYIYY